MKPVLGGMLMGVMVLPAHVLAESVADGHTAAYQAGTQIGSVVGVVALTAGIIKCLTLLSRRSTNFVCVISLLLVLLGWLISSTLAVLLKFEHFSAANPLFLAATLLTALFYLAGLVCGIVALATYDRERYSQGRAQATWAIVLSSLLLLVFFVVLGKGIYSGIERNQAMVENVPAVPEGQPQVFEKPDLNFSVSISPEEHWVSLKPELINRVASFVFRRSRPDMFCMVIAEALGDSVLLNNESASEVAKSSLASVTTILSQHEEKQTVHGRTFNHITSNVRLSNGQGALYQHWILTLNGYAYQIIFWTKPDEGVPQSAIMNMVESFRILDPNRKVNRSAPGSYVDAKYPEWGYATHLEGKGWKNWVTKQTRQVLAKTQVFQKSASFEITPLRFEGEGPDLKALSRGLLPTIGLDYSKEDEFEATSLHLPSGEGVELTKDAPDANGKDMSFIVHIIKRPHIAYLVAGWMVKGADNVSLSMLREAIDSVEFLPEPTAPSPSSTEEQAKELSGVYNLMGLSYSVRERWDEAALLFKTSFQMRDKNALALENYTWVLRRNGKSKEALEYLAPRVGNFPDNPTLALRMAWLKLENDDEPEGQKAFLGCIDHGLRKESDLLDWMKFLAQKQHNDDAVAAADAYLKKTPTANVQRWKAQTLSGAGKLKEALTCLEEAAKNYPEDEKVRCELGEVSNRNGDYERAGSIAEKMIQDDKDNVRARMMLGWSQVGRKWFRDAKATFEAAAKLDPHDENIKRAITETSANLGQGDDTDFKTPLDPVAIPDALETEIAKCEKAASPPEDANAMYLRRVTGYFFKKGSPMRTTYHRRIQILTKEGVNEFSTLEFPFDPLYEQIYVNHIEVKNAVGEIQAKSTLNDAYVVDRDRQDKGSFHKILHVQVPALKVGSIVDVEVTREDRSNTDEMPFTRCSFGHFLPVASEAYFLTADPNAVVAKTVRDESLRVIKSGSSISWFCSHPPLFAMEPMALPPGDFQPEVLLCKAIKSWEEVGRDYLKDISDRLAPDDYVRSTAAKLVEGATTDQQKVTVLAHHVQKTMTYKAIEFGTRARRPNPAADSLRQQLGDCKDHALALHLLLKAAGIESNLALVHSTFQVAPSVPSLDQFDHMIVQVPSLGKQGWLDVTDKFLQPVMLPPDNLWEHQALVLDKTPHLEKLPGVPPNSAGVVVQRSVSPEGASDLRVDETLTLTGYNGIYMRASFGSEDSATRFSHLQHLLDRQQAVRLQEAQFDGLEDTEKPVKLHAVYFVHNAVGIHATESSASLPAAWEKEFLQIGFVKDRKSPFRFRLPFELTSDITVRLPADAHDASFSMLNNQGHSEFCSWEMKPQAKNEGDSPEVSVHFHFVEQPGTHEAKLYSACYDAWEQARTAWDPRFTWEQKR